MNKDINNKQVSVDTGTNYTDKDYLNMLLMHLKNLQKNMSVALTEASNENLYKEYEKVFLEISKFQRKAYEMMYKFGWYQLEKATNTKISNLLNNLEKDITNLE